MIYLGEVETLLVARSFSTTLHLVWAILWGLVALHYGRAALHDWYKQGGSWASAIPDFLSPFTWAIRSFLCHTGILRGDKYCAIGDVPMKFDQGLTLRFSIFLGSLTPMILGFIYLIPSTRAGWSYYAQNSPLIAISILSAGGHLFLAYRHNAVAWRTLVMTSVFVLMLAPLAFYFALRP